MAFWARHELPEEDEVLCHEQRLSYRIRASTRRRTLALQVDTDGSVRVYAPASAGLPALRGFVQQNFPWIHRKQLEFAARTKASVDRLGDGAQLRYLDDILSLRLVSPTKTCHAVTRQGNELWVSAAKPERLRPVLEDWYRRQARIHIAQRMEHFAPLVGRAPKGLHIRAQRTRWGSCSARGIISINWRLLQAPAHCLDYVVVHELCHLLQPNHSARFWSEVARVIPDYRAIRREMREIHKILLL